MKKVKYRGIIIRERLNGSGNTSYRVECPFSWFERTTFRQFPTKDQAKGFVDAQISDKARFGSLANSLGTEQRLDASKAIKLLSVVGVSLEACAEFYLMHNQPTSGDIQLSELTEKFLHARKAGLGTKRGRPLRPRSLADLKVRMSKFNLTFGTRLVKEVAVSKIENWLHRDEWSLQNRQNYYRTLHTFFEFALSKGYRADNPIKSISKPSPDESVPGILSIVQCENLLHAGLEAETDFNLLGYVVLGMFCGIRSAELERLDWSAVDLESRHVTISANIAKARSIRNVEIPDTALLWLMHCSKRVGPVRPLRFRERFDKLRKLAGINHWPNNALRHSAGSYHYAMHEDSTKTAHMLGHTQDSVLFKHYRALTKKTDARAFFNLTPKDPRPISARLQAGM